MNPNFSDELISAYLDGELTASEQLVVEQMLIDNPAARRLFEELRSLRAGLQSLPKNRLDEGFVSRVLNAAERGMLTSRSDEAFVQSSALPQIAPDKGVPDKGVPDKRQLDATIQLHRWQRRFWLMSTLAAALLIALSWSYARQDRRDLAQLRSEPIGTDLRADSHGQAPPAAPSAAPSEELSDMGVESAGGRHMKFQQSYGDSNSESLHSLPFQANIGPNEVPAFSVDSDSPAPRSFEMVTENAVDRKKLEFGRASGDVPDSLDRKSNANRDSDGGIANGSLAAESAVMETDRSGSDALGLGDSRENSTVVVRFNIESIPDGQTASAGVGSLLSLLPDQPAMGRALSRGLASEVQEVGEPKKDSEIQDSSLALDRFDVSPQPELIVVEGTRQQVWATLEKMASNPQVVSAQLWIEPSRTAPSFANDFKLQELAGEGDGHPSAAAIHNRPGGGGGGLGAAGAPGGTVRGPVEGVESDAEKVGRNVRNGRSEDRFRHGQLESNAGTAESKATAARRNTREPVDSPADFGDSHKEEQIAALPSAGNVRWRSLVPNPLFEFSINGLGDEEEFFNRGPSSNDEASAPAAGKPTRAAVIAPQAPQSGLENKVAAAKAGKNNEIVRVIVFFQAVERALPSMKAGVEPESAVAPAIEPEK